jgi:hypothetical protein
MINCRFAERRYYQGLGRSEVGCFYNSDGSRNLRGSCAFDACDMEKEASRYCKFYQPVIECASNVELLFLDIDSRLKDIESNISDVRTMICRYKHEV